MNFFSLPSIKVAEYIVHGSNIIKYQGRKCSAWKIDDAFFPDLAHCTDNPGPRPSSKTDHVLVLSELETGLACLSLANLMSDCNPVFDYCQQSQKWTLTQPYLSEYSVIKLGKFFITLVEAKYSLMLLHSC